MPAQNNVPFITFEGGEGGGKSTQIKLLEEWLKEKSLNILRTREPGGCTGAELIRELVLTGDVDRWEPVTEALLYAAARAEHVARTIRPALADNKWVLCDRFEDSSIAYQGAGRGVGVKNVEQMQRLAFGNLKPTLTFLLDLPVEIGLKRAIGREGTKTANVEDRFERMDVSIHETLRATFLKLADAEPDRFIILDATKSIDELQEQIRATVVERFFL
ncbi:dTMP kinase [Kordiimonas sp. SCSIO 12603]|uniref:dTMP kinase n=1 Tax=Kordiimonas sp. SCSIO 12603 TaxID=2829596 RepID=UPI002103C328|nr:dTMP kinase [Kordiimonas sp. SCSIO 12603]UTW57405.1 dTMP kinase [Kordiimonas sp. SCSIO 12603]